MIFTIIGMPARFRQDFVEKRLAFTTVLMAGGNCAVDRSRFAPLLVFAAFDDRVAAATTHMLIDFIQPTVGMKLLVQI